MIRKPALGLMLVIAAIAAAAQDSARPADSPDQQLWAEVEQLAIAVPSTQPYEPRFDVEIGRLGRLIARLERYQRQFPGGAHFDDSIVAELTARFRLATLTNESGEFVARCRQLTDRPMSDTVREQVAEFTRLADRIAGGPARLAELREAIASRPTATQSSQAAIDPAAEAGSPATAPPLNGTDSPGSGSDAPADVAAGLRRREQSRGRPLAFAVEGNLAGGLAAAGFCAQPVVVLIWASWDECSLDAAANLSRFRAAHPEFGILGVSIDLDVERMREAVEAYHLDGAQIRSPRGWADELITTWGLRRIPAVIVIDADGRLLDIREGIDPFGPILRAPIQ